MNSTRISARSRFLLTSAAGALLFSGQAFAADKPADQAADAAAIGNGEIIVTAQRRDQSIQDVPITIQALSGESLGKLNVANFNDLLKFTPNVSLGSNGPGQGGIFLRGLSAGFAGNQSAATIAPFPNVALYLDDQSMQFPARNADIYVADLERIEVLEGPQGTLFGGGAEAGAIRYITNKPKLNEFSGSLTGSFGGTAGGAPNAAMTAVLNVPVVNDKLALRAVIFGDHHGGYIDNVRSKFTRLATDPGLVSYGIVPTPTNQSNAGQYDNNTVAGSDYNPVDYLGGRISAKWQVTPDWDLLVSESFQDLQSKGTFTSNPIGSDYQTLGDLQTTTFSPSSNSDRYWNTAWTVNGKVGDWKVVYTGAYMTRHINTQQDYTNYSRTSGGVYYQCTGPGTGWSAGEPYCYSPVANWNDKVRNTHHSEELRISSPESGRVRVIGGAFYEKFKINDIMRFNYRTIPTCTSALIGAGVTCSGVVQTYPGSTANEPGNEPSDTTFGEDTQRGYRQYAFFGSVDFDVLPNLTITAGTRYYNYKEFEVGSQYQTRTGPSFDSCVNVLVCNLAVKDPSYDPAAHGGLTAVQFDASKGNVNIDANNDDVTYHGFRSKAEIAWKPAEHTLVYGLFSQGFRPGGFNRATKLILPDVNGTNQFNRPNGYAPDSLTNWEAGVKTDLFDHKVTFNLSAYYMIWENIQIGFFNPAGGFGNTTFFTNGANFHVKGAEVQISARPADGLTFQLGATYNDSKQVTSPCFISNVSKDTPGNTTGKDSTSLGKCITGFYKGGSERPVQDPFGATGSSLPFAPNFQANLRGRYEIPTSGSVKWFVAGAVSYNGPQYNEPATYPSGEVLNDSVTQGPNGALIPGTTILRYRQAAYALVDASIGFKHDNWDLSIFGENLTNTHASTFTTSGQFIKARVPVRPLVYGIKIGTSF